MIPIGAIFDHFKPFYPFKSDFEKIDFLVANKELQKNFDQTGVTRDFCNSLQPTMPLTFFPKP